MDPHLKPYSWTSSTPIETAPAAVPHPQPGGSPGRIVSAPVRYPSGQLLVRCAWVRDRQASGEPMMGATGGGQSSVAHSTPTVQTITLSNKVSA